MSKDNSTGKNKDFYDLGKRMFDQIQPIKPRNDERELGLDYQPDWKAEYQKAVDLHCITLDELREARAEIKALHAILVRNAERIVDLQTHIYNFEGKQ